MDAEQQVAATARATRPPRRRATALVPPEGTA
jgi:hypothetical protein